MSPNPENFEKLEAYVDGELDAAGRAEVEQQLAGNPQLRRLMAELVATRDLVRGLPRAKAPADVLETFQGSLERAALLGDDVADKEVVGRINRWPQFMSVAAIVLLSLGLAGVIYKVVLPHGKPASPIAMGGGPATGPGTNGGVVRDDAPGKAADEKELSGESFGSNEDVRRKMPAGSSAPTFAAKPDAADLSLNEREAKSTGSPPMNAPPAGPVVESLKAKAEASTSTLAARDFAEGNGSQRFTGAKADGSNKLGATLAAAPADDAIVMVVRTDNPARANTDVARYFLVNNITYGVVNVANNLALDGAAANSSANSLSDADAMLKQQLEPAGQLGGRARRPADARNEAEPSPGNPSTNPAQGAFGGLGGGGGGNPAGAGNGGFDGQQRGARNGYAAGGGYGDEGRAGRNTDNRNAGNNSVANNAVGNNSVGNNDNYAQQSAPAPRPDNNDATNNANVMAKNNGLANNGVAAGGNGYGENARGYAANQQQAMNRGGGNATDPQQEVQRQLYAQNRAMNRQPASVELQQEAPQPEPGQQQVQRMRATTAPDASSPTGGAVQAPVIALNGTAVNGVPLQGNTYRVMLTPRQLKELSARLQGDGNQWTEIHSPANAEGLELRPESLSSAGLKMPAAKDRDATEDATKLYAAAAAAQPDARRAMRGAESPATADKSGLPSSVEAAKSAREEVRSKAAELKQNELAEAATPPAAAPAATPTTKPAVAVTGAAADMESTAKKGATAIGQDQPAPTNFSAQFRPATLPAAGVELADGEQPREVFIVVNDQPVNLGSVAPDRATTQPAAAPAATQPAPAPEPSQHAPAAK